MLDLSVEAFRPAFEVEAANFLQEKTIAACERTERMRPIMDVVIRYVMNEGKRLRPLLFCWGYRGAGGLDEESALRASVSIELIHSYLLIHDDIIDRDERRRGQPTVHVAYQTLFTTQPDEHLGTSLAIVAGDVLCTYAYELLTESPFPAECRLAAIARLNRLLDEVLTGESVDILAPYLGADLKEQDIMTISHYKTAVYTVDGPLQLGGLLAGASPELLAAYTAFAVPIGIAFQLRDDILGVYGNPEVTGKSVSSDLQEGKRTLLIHEAFKRANAADQEYLRTWLGNKQLGKGESDHLRKIIKESGALETVERSITKLYQEAITTLKSAEFNPDIVVFLEELATYIIKRDK